MREYRIAVGSAEQLEKTIKSLVQEGWEFQGGVSALEGDRYAQAMYRYFEDTLVDLYYIVSKYDISQGTIYRQMRAGNFPASIKKGKNAYWHLSEIQKKLKGKERNNGSN